MRVLGLFAGLALLLAGVGLYGVLSYMVTVNQVSIGIRLALGAPPERIFRLVADRAFRLAAAGMVVGLLGYLALRGVLGKVVFGVAPSDPHRAVRENITIASY